MTAYAIDNRIVDGSFPEEYDDLNAVASFRRTLTASIAYAPQAHGVPAQDRALQGCFQNSHDWNTVNTVTALSTVVSWCSGGVLRQIERIIKPLTEKGASNMIELRYQQSGDYLIPSLTASMQEATPLGKYGRMRKTYLKEHRPVLYNRLVLNGSLNAYLAEIDQAAQTRIDEMMPQLAAASGVAEDLKAANPMLWVGLMNSLKAQAEEIILTELVYS